MRTTIDMPDALYRKTKAVAALRGSSMKDLIVRAVEHEVKGAPVASRQGRKQTKSPKVIIDPVTKLPLIQWKGPKMDLSNFDFDDLLG
ncbi:MAG TPA: hypothetical protein VN841_06500 [Bryobacteraceae bacterium]|nr:hypothetical protein [Bryobacteraceae bacterium]